jgi:probable F420-dependent oxidoreductase
MGSAAAVRQIGGLAEELGYDAIVTGDHIAIPKEIKATYPYSKMSRSMGVEPTAVFTTIDWIDSFTVLAMLVPVTETVRLGTSVTIVPYRHPLDMARVLASLDQASRGRVIFGAGVGWMREEFELLGLRFEERGAQTDEYLRVMQAVWTEDHPRFQGKYVQIDKDLHFAPKPYQKPHPPIWVGGESKPALRRIVEFGAGWHIGLVEIEDLRPRFDELRGLMEAGGRSYDDLEITWMVDNSRTDAAALRAYRDLGVHGLFVTTASPDADAVCGIMRDFKRRVEDTVGTA